MTTTISISLQEQTFYETDTNEELYDKLMQALNIIVDEEGMCDTTQINMQPLISFTAIDKEFDRLKRESIVLTETQQKEIALLDRISTHIHIISCCFKE